MSSASLSRLIEKVAFKLWNNGNDRTTSTVRIPPELLDKVVDYLHDDRQALLALSLVSKETTLTRSRGHLFSTIVFTTDSQFDKFLLLLDRPWTSFTFSVQTLHLKDLFHTTRNYRYRSMSSQSIERVISHLSNVEGVWLTSISWRVIPSHIRDILFHCLQITDLQLDRVEFYGDEEPCEFFSILAPKPNGSISFYDILSDDAMEFSPTPSIFQQPLHIKSLDTNALVRFLGGNLLNSCPRLTVDSLHLRLPSLTSMERDNHIRFISNFVQHVGPSLQRLFVQLSVPFYKPDALLQYESIDLSKCSSLRVVHIGHIILSPIDTDMTTNLQSTLWKILSQLPGDTVDTLVVSFSLPQITLEGRRCVVQDFAWVDFVSRLRQMFAHLNTLTIRLGGVHFLHKTPEYEIIIDSIRETGLGQLEDEGVVSFDLIPVSAGLLAFEPNWRDATGSW